MSLLLDALNRAQKLKESENASSESDAANDASVDQDTENLSTDVDMEGLELNDTEHKPIEQENAKLSISDIDEETKELEPINDDALTLDSAENLSEKREPSIQSSPNLTLEDEAEPKQDALSNLEEFELEESKQPSFGDLSLESESDDSNIEKIKTNDNASTISMDPEKFDSTDTIKATDSADLSESKPSAEPELEPRAETKTDTPSNESKVVAADSTPKVEKVEKKSIDIQALRKQRKTKKLLIASTSTIIIALVATFGGMYYYENQLNDLNYNQAGMQNPARFAGRSLTPPGAVPPEENQPASLDNKVTNNGVTTSEETGKMTGVIASNSKETKISPPVQIKQKAKSPAAAVIPKKSKKQANKPKTTALKPKRAKKVKPKKLASVPISHQQKQDPIHPLLVVAFDAFQSGDDKSARKKYQEVLNLDRDNRDALLGLGAIAVRNKQLEIARNYYTRLLKQNPSDSVARSALVGLVGQMDPIKAETELKLLLNREPGASYLHFALGNTYIVQQRWLEAQNAFFNAYRIDSSNPDYAYNVAVSLDHLGERKQAIKYYNQALTSSSGKVISFNSTLVKQRLLTLQKSGSGK